MALDIGTRLGSHEILDKLGEGGMGEVYLAQDTRLNRQVAIKVLPDSYAGDPDRVARFHREAQAVAALNHPNIAAIYELAEQGDTKFLVLELVAGETLAERIQRERAEGKRQRPEGGQGLPVDEALTIATQILDALETAHEKGICHRDLKPANVKLTPDGAVKVLDFGLAKFLQGPAPVRNLTHSPTLTVAGTLAGVILGTAGYMSPEQAKGYEADQRSDLFSFGCIFYELLTGRRAFDGETASEILASVLKVNVDLSALPPNLNPRLKEVLQRCLEKNPKKRWYAAGDIRVEIESLMGRAMVADAASGATHVVAKSNATTMAAACVATAAIVGGSVWALTRPAPTAARVVRLQAPPPAAAPLFIDSIAPDIAISPDGTRLVYTAAAGQLHVRQLDQPDAAPLGGITGARGPFFSPDGEWIGYFQASDLKKVSFNGGPSLTICAECAQGNRGATWGTNDSIIFSAAGGSAGLRQVPAAGGEPVTLAAPDEKKGEQGYLWPELLPGNQAVLFAISAQGGSETGVIAVRDLKTGAQQIVARGGSQPHYLTSGHLVYSAAGTLRAVGFDVKALTSAGNPVPVMDRVITKATGSGDFSVSGDGTLAYIAGDQYATALRLAWIDRRGHEEIVPAPLRSYFYLRLSPDGRRGAGHPRPAE